MCGKKYYASIRGDGELKLHFKIWLENDGKVFGEGPYDLLTRVDKLGSLNSRKEKCISSRTPGAFAGLIHHAFCFYEA
jgi:hypothetical protein